MSKLLNVSLIIAIVVILLDIALSADENKNNIKNNSASTTTQTTPTSTTPLPAVTVNCTSSNVADCANKKKSSSRTGPTSETADSNLMMQGFYVVIGITVLAIGYFVFRAIKLRRRPKQGAVGRRLRRENVEMQRLTDEQFDEEDDAVLYDRTTSNTQAPK